MYSVAPSNRLMDGNGELTPLWVDSILYSSLVLT